MKFRFKILIRYLCYDSKAPRHFFVLFHVVVVIDDDNESLVTVQGRMYMPAS